MLLTHMNSTQSRPPVSGAARNAWSSVRARRCTTTTDIQLRTTTATTQLWILSIQPPADHSDAVSCSPASFTESALNSFKEHDQVSSTVSSNPTRSTSVTDNHSRPVPSQTALAGNSCLPVGYIDLTILSFLGHWYCSVNRLFIKRERRR